MKPVPALKLALRPALLTALLFGSLLTPVLAQSSEEAGTPPAAAGAGKYTFAASTLESRVFVRLYNDADEDFSPVIIEVLADAGHLNKMERATAIAKRLQDACDADPTFANDLSVASQGGEVVVVVKMQQGQLVVTADDRSKRTLNASTREVYAKRIIDGIQSRLKGIKLRDAALDYSLTGDQKSERAAEYYKEAQDALDPRDKDADVAVSKYKLAIGLSDNNYYRLQLAQLYTQLNQKEAARTLYQHVESAPEADPDDRKVASDALHRPGASKV